MLAVITKSETKGMRMAFGDGIRRGVFGLFSS